MNELFFTRLISLTSPLRNETLPVADHLHIKISKLALFNIKLSLKKDNILHILNELN